MKRAATTAYIRVQMQQNETIHFFCLYKESNAQSFTTSSKPVKNKGDISDKLWTDRRETETMLNACLNQKISWSNEEKEKEYKQMLDSSKDIVHWRFI